MKIQTNDIASSIDKLTKIIENIDQNPQSILDNILAYIPLLASILIPVLLFFYGYKKARAIYEAQESIKVEVEKLRAANKWLLLIASAQINVKAIMDDCIKNTKQKEFEGIPEGYLVPHIIYLGDPIIDTIEDLTFITPQKSETFDTKDWNHLLKINSVIRNYNALLTKWEMWNKDWCPVKERLLDKYAASNFNNIDKTDKRDHKMVMIFAELLTVQTKESLDQLTEFMKNFPKVALSKIDKNKVNPYGAVLEFIPAKKVREAAQKDAGNQQL